MPKNIQRLALAVALMTGGLLMLSAPANAATNQISGTALLDTAGPARQCPAEPTGYVTCDRWQVHACVHASSITPRNRRRREKSLLQTTAA